MIDPTGSPIAGGRSLLVNVLALRLKRDTHSARQKVLIQWGIERVNFEKEKEVIEAGLKIDAKNSDLQAELNKVKPWEWWYGHLAEAGDDVPGFGETRTKSQS